MTQSTDTVRWGHTRGAGRVWATSAHGVGLGWNKATTLVRHIETCWEDRPFSAQRMPNPGTMVMTQTTKRLKD